jgi:signal transduction histidine kinase
MNDPHNASEQLLSIEWRPHFYRTRWFFALCVFIAASVVWGSYRMHVRNIRRRFAAVLDERNRLAREMHDTLIQGCVGVSTLLEAASHAQEVSPKLSHGLLDRARREVRSTVDEARMAIWNLRHGADRSQSLAQAVSRLVERVGAETGIAVRFESTGSPLALDVEVEQSLMMLIREALQNAARHANPNNLLVRLDFDRRRLGAEIEDDGRGFDASVGQSPDGQHYGLIGMQERVERLGGEFTLESAPGKGTKVRLSIPVDKPKRLG